MTLTDEQVAQLAEEIVERLLAVPEGEREEVLSAVLHNGIFCQHCGIGSREHPQYLVECTICGMSVVLTTAGRPDDPKSIRMPCKMAGSA